MATSGRACSRMSLHPLAQLGQLALARGLAALRALFDVLRAAPPCAPAFTRAMLDTVLCLSVGLVVFAFGMAAGSGQVRLFMFLPSRPAGRAILPGSAGRFCRRWRNLHAAARKKRAKSRPPDEKSQKKFGFLQKNASKIAADVLE
ncbi:MAG: hypothetical protein ACLTG4_05550 [Oscillospiraceae bacterium]